MSDVVVDVHVDLTGDRANVLRDFDALDGALLVRSVVKAIRAAGHNEGIVMRLDGNYRLAPHIIKGIWPAANAWHAMSKDSRGR